MTGQCQLRIPPSTRESRGCGCPGHSGRAAPREFSKTTSCNCSTKASCATSPGAAPVIGLNYKDKRNDGQLWLARHGNPYTLSVFDPDGRIGLDYGVYGVPETYLIDRSGRIRHKHNGPVTPEVLEKTLLPQINELLRSPN